MRLLKTHKQNFANFVKKGISIAIISMKFSVRHNCLINLILCTVDNISRQYFHRGGAEPFKI